MKVRATKGFIHEGELHKVGEEFELFGYAFSWLTEHGYVESIGSEEEIISEELPPLEEPKVKRNVQRRSE